MSTLKVDRVEARQTTTLPANLLPVTASAWVNFNGVGTVSILDSHNVSSVTDNGVGNFFINFATQMLNQNYAAVATCTATTTVATLAPTISNIAIEVRDRGTVVGGFVDVPNNSLVTFGGQS